MTQVLAHTARDQDVQTYQQEDVQGLPILVETVPETLPSVRRVALRKAREELIFLDRVSNEHLVLLRSEASWHAFVVPSVAYVLICKVLVQRECVWS